MLNFCCPVQERSRKSVQLKRPKQIAKEFIPDKTQRLTEAYTHGFSPLEQYDEEARPGDYTDVYSLAATLYYLLTTKVPPSSWTRVSRDSLKPPQQENLNISDAVNRAILMGMSLYVKDRPQTVQEWLDICHNSRRVLVNYRRLEELLSAKKWQSANEETAAILLKICDRQEQGWLQLEDIKKIPCIDFRTIDQLWVKYSKGKFGFSVQNRIWEKIGGNPDANDKTWERFGEEVGWSVKTSWHGRSYWLDVESFKFKWLPEAINKPERGLGQYIKWFLLLPGIGIVYFLVYVYRIFNNVIRLLSILKLHWIPKKGTFPKMSNPGTGIIIGRGAKVGLLNHQEDMVRFRQSVAQQIAKIKQIERELGYEQNEAHKWLRNAHLAQQKGDEGLAKLALERRQNYIDLANDLQERVDKETSKSEQSKRKLIAQERKTSMMKTQYDWEMTYLAEKLAECNIS